MPDGDSSRPADNVRQQAGKILEYFVNHTHASDSVEGIARWRLLQQDIYQTIHQVERALEFLVKMDLLRQQGTQATGRLYVLNTARIAECREFMCDFASQDKTKS